MNRVLNILIGMVIGFTVHGFASRALDFEVGVGRSEFCCLQDGVWWQSDFGFNGSVRVPSFEIGVRKRFGDWSLHGAYVDLGTATGQNIATMRDDEFGSFDRTKRCDQTQQKNCLGFFANSQHVHGALLGAAYGKSVYGVRIEGELGQFFYQTEMSVQVLCPNCGLDHRYAFGAGGTFSSTSDMRRSSYFALKAEYKGVFLTYRRFTRIDGGGKIVDDVEGQFSIGLTNGPVNQLLVGVTL